MDMPRIGGQLLGFRGFRVCVAHLPRKFNIPYLREDSVNQTRDPSTILGFGVSGLGHFLHSLVKG